MVEKFFQKSLSDLAASQNIISTVVVVTNETLASVLSKIKENLLSDDKGQNSRNSSRYDQESQEINQEENHLKNIFDAKGFVAKMTRERWEREKKKIEREEKARVKLVASIEEEERKKYSESLKKEEEKQKRIEILLRKKEARKKMIEELKEIGEKEFREVISNKPMYLRIEENYEEQVLMPELEKKKAELARKREFLQPIRRSEILDHMKKYQETAMESQVRREIQAKNKQLEFKYNSSACAMKSRFTDRVLEEEKKKKEESEKAEHEKVQLVDKRKKYASIVKEMFVPSVDEFKKQEMILIQERLKHPVRIKLNEKSISDEENKPKKKWKKNSMIPDPPPKREAKVVDYLAEKRKKRGSSVQIYSFNYEPQHFLDDSDIDEEERVKRIKKRAEHLEKEATKFERYIKSVASIEP
jgi:hypothetical protein